MQTLEQRKDSKTSRDLHKLHSLLYLNPRMKHSLEKDFEQFHNFMLKWTEVRMTPSR